MKTRITSFLAVAVMVAFALPSFAQPGYGNTHKVKRNDADGDGIKDKRDKCPATPAGVLVDENGCPIDTDKDGVADYLDKCIDLPGTADMNGCQDKDKDGVADSEDACPDVPGIGRFKGCPDSDGDGIQDSEDKCPNEKGIDRFRGCPDSDGDGVVDADDKCPSTPSGLKVDATGCPADSDGDGVADSNDKCPDTQAGIAVDMKGCPADSDKDGVPDSLDKCPTVPGLAENAGCPAVKKAPAPKRMNFAIRKINFDAGSALLKPSYYAMLDEVVTLLNEYPDYYIRISGNSDGTEKGGATIGLSEGRADAVKSYLLSRMVPESKMTVAGFGKTRPIAASTNTANKAQNRRVELEMYLK